MSAPPHEKAATTSASGYGDGFGRRGLAFKREDGAAFERLHLRPEFAIYERPLRDAFARLAAHPDPRFVSPRAIERDARTGALVVVSPFVSGDRLGDLLEAAAERARDEEAVPGIDVALGFLMEVLPALEALRVTTGLSHGAIAPSRCVFTGDGRVVLTECGFAPVLQRLNFGRERLWREFGIAVPPVAGAARFDEAGDISQAALMAVMLIVGRPMNAYDAVDVMPDWLSEAVEIAQTRGSVSFAVNLQRFLQRALPLPGRRPYPTIDAALDDVRLLAAAVGIELCRGAVDGAVRDATRGASTAGTFEGVESAETPLRPEPVVIESPGPRAQGSAAVVEEPLPDAWDATPVDPAGVPLATAPAQAVPPPLVFQPPQEPVVLQPVAAAPVPQPVFAPLPTTTEPFWTPPASEAIAPGPRPSITLKVEPNAGRAPRHERPREFFNPYVEPPRLAEPRSPRRLPWKFAAAAAILMVTVFMAGRAYLPEAPAVTASVARMEPVTVAAPPPVTTGTIVVQTQPGGARVLLDGSPAGETPLRIVDVAPGRHVLTFVTPTATLKRTVKIEANETLTLDVPVFSGWIAIFAPIVLEVSEDGRVLGTTDQGRLLLPPGRHTLTLTSSDYGYSAVHAVDVEAGEVRSLNVEPTGTVNLNAVPWAEVWIDGRNMGETPVANLSLPLGNREIVFRHPEFGERKMMTRITAGAPIPVSVDFSR